MEAYRARRRRVRADDSQSELQFETVEADSPGDVGTAVAVAESPVKDDFSFTIAIGRMTESKRDDARMTIDVSLPPNSEPATAADAAPQSSNSAEAGLYPVASIEERRQAAIIDLVCLLFAYGGFLALFSSLGGQFTLSKLSAAVCVATFAIVYLQYFALFTIFGGTTPGMMLRGLQVMSFTGETPAPRQMLLRTVGYILSAGTLFLGFLWALWDEDALTWHDRISHTYLSSTETLADTGAQPAHHH